MKKWVIVGFNHPENRKSIIYRQNLNKVQLNLALNKGIEKGCNLFSIRGVEEKGDDKK